MVKQALTAIELNLPLTPNAYNSPLGTHALMEMTMQLSRKERQLAAAALGKEIAHLRTFEKHLDAASKAALADMRALWAKLKGRRNAHNPRPSSLSSNIVRAG